jgi:hypothetical protein
MYVDRTRHLIFIRNDDKVDQSMYMIPDYF